MCIVSSDSSRKMASKEDIKDESNIGKRVDGVSVEEEAFTFPVLKIVKEAQQQHGLRHGDYQRYRQYCMRRIRRIRKAMHFPQGTKNRVQPKKITAELLKDSRCLYLPLVDAERAWAYAMQLKSESNTEPRKKFHMMSRLRKAVQHADVMETVCTGGRYDARTKLEVQAYRAWMHGLLELEDEDWKMAMENFSQSKTIYEKLADAVSDVMREMYIQRCEEIEPNVRYCAYNIGDESAVADLLQMRLKVGLEDPLTSRLDELIEKTRERQSVALSEVTWLGRTVPVKCEAVRALLLNLQLNGSKQELSSGGQQQKLLSMVTDDQKLSMCESRLKEVIDAQQALRDDLKDDQVFKMAIRGGAGSGPQPIENSGKVSDSVFLYTYLAYLRQTTTVERNLLMIDSLKSTTKKESDGAKRNRPQDFARLYDVIIQNLMEIAHLPGLEEQTQLCRNIEVQIIGYKAFRCFHVAQTYSSVKKWKEAIALFEKTLEYARTALDGYRNTSMETTKKDKECKRLAELMLTVDGLKYSVRAASILDNQELTDDSLTSTTTADSKKPLIERLHEYNEDRSVATKNSNLAHFPPDFQPIPAKPLFFDLALSLVEFPSLDDKMEQKKQKAAGGITGLVKGWLWGGGSAS